MAYARNRLTIIIHIHIILLTFLARRIEGSSQCGITNDSPNLLESKIVGGVDVGYYKYPWFAALWLHETVWCGGTLIAPNTVLTAAHCFRSYFNKSTPLEDVFTVKLGMYNSCSIETTQTDHTVRKVIIHEKYLKKQPYYDIAMMKINGDTSAYEPACLPSKPLSDREKGHEGIIIGFGNTKTNVDAYPCQMYEGRVLLYPFTMCKSMIVNNAADKNDWNIVNAMCAGYMSGGVDTCQGDSGGPLMVLSRTGHYFLVGITSFGYNCAQPGLLGIYTDVSKYLTWIRDNMDVVPNRPPISGGGNNNSIIIIPKTIYPAYVYESAWFILPYLNRHRGYNGRMLHRTQGTGAASLAARRRSKSHTNLKQKHHQSKH